MTTMYRIAYVLFILTAMAFGGCSGNVETTDDSTRIETEVPKVEVGDRKPDLDPRTDDDIDVDTPAPGDN
jgi:PBP1b-binding outer membrane lipoprotein LpoB